MRNILIALLLCGCVGTTAPRPELTMLQVVGGDYGIAYWRKDTDMTAPVHIYIEGDGHAFDGHGRPTSDPTPRGTLVRDLAMCDDAPNVVYLARPCQFEVSPACTSHDWTDGRFSEGIIEEMSVAVRHLAAGRPIVLVGYSGGAYVSAAIIERNPDLDVKQWITIAGVLNHVDWTEYFGDAPLSGSMNLNTLPQMFARHYVAEWDSVVPRTLSERWVGAENLIVVPHARHDKFPGLELDFMY